MTDELGAEAGRGERGLEEDWPLWDISVLFDFAAHNFVEDPDSGTGDLDNSFPMDHASP